MREKIKSFDMIRAICTIGIVLYHYSYNYIEYGIAGNHLSFFKFVSGDWGSLFVAMFFMLSGAVLIYNHADKFKLGKFFYRRWCSIFPMFYLAWFVGYLLKVKELGSWLWGGSRRRFIYTFLGIDGYFLKPGFNVNYYTLGEWFLGAILMVYLLFPVLRYLFVRHEKSGYMLRIAATIAIAIAEIYLVINDNFSIPASRNIITCVFDFWIGMLIMDGVISYKINRNKKLAIATGIMAVVVMLLPIEAPSVIIASLAGALLMITFMNIGESVMKKETARKLFGIVSYSSFGIFLVHHVLIYNFMKQFSGSQIDMIQSVGLFAAVFLMSLALGWLLAGWGKLVTKGLDVVKDAIARAFGL